MMRALLTTLTLLTIIALSSSPTPQAAALSYPNGPITLVIPLAPGDATDIAGRAMADELAKLLKVAVVPVNRPGAGMVIGTDSVVKAKKDGDDPVDSERRRRLGPDSQPRVGDVRSPEGLDASGIDHEDAHPPRGSRGRPVQELRGDGRLREEEPREGPRGHGRDGLGRSPQRRDD